MSSPRDSRVTPRADRAAATRYAILEAVGAILREGGIHDSSMEAIAARAGVTRVTLYRNFGSKQALLEALVWHLLAAARLDRIDAAHAHPDVRTAVRDVLRANCQMFADLADAMPLALALAQFDGDIATIVEATYHGRRHEAMERLARRIIKDGAAAPGWTKSSIADALLVLSSLEAFRTLVDHRGHTVDKGAAFLFHMADCFLAD